MKRITDIGEKKLISDIIRPIFATDKRNIEVGPGDDAAVISFPAGSSLVTTIDKIPERLIAQELGLIGFNEVGYYLVVTSLSDLAAMGAEPLGILLSICLPSQFSIEDFVQLMHGIKRASNDFDVPIIGGDTKGGSAISLVSTGLGHIEPRKVLTRCAAKVDQIVCITGNPGKFGTALAYFLNVEKLGHFLAPEQEILLALAFRSPKPRIEAGKVLSNSGICGACQDISDGIGQTAIEISTASDLGIEINMDLLLNAGPACAKSVAEKLTCTPYNILLGPGADFELMFTIDSDSYDTINKALIPIGVPIHPVGRTINDKGVWLVNANARIQVESPGFEHLTGRDDSLVINSKYKLKN
jgi:thiamine-monophosphate kinase